MVPAARTPPKTGQWRTLIDGKEGERRYGGTGEKVSDSVEVKGLEVRTSLRHSA